MKLTVWKFSPRMRGWTSLHLRQLLFLLRFPRACGDGPRGERLTGRSSRFSPRMRGWTVESVKDYLKADRFPRACGDGPEQTPFDLLRKQFSPRMRGWTEGSFALPFQVEVFPAHAGMDRMSSLKRRSRQRFPRACGDGPRLLATGAFEEVSFPRACGDGPYSPTSLKTSTPFSPRMRGWTALVQGYIPVYSRFPRACGDGPISAGCKNCYAEFSPRMRGWTEDSLDTYLLP